MIVDSMISGTGAATSSSQVTSFVELRIVTKAGIRVVGINLVDWSCVYEINDEKDVESIETLFFGSFDTTRLEKCGAQSSPCAEYVLELTYVQIAT